MNSLAEATELFQRAAFDPGSLPRTLDDVAATLGYSRIGVVDSRRGPLAAIVSESGKDDLQAYVAEGWHGKDERTRYLNRAPTGNLVLDHEHIPEQVRDGSAAYRDFYLPRDLAWSASWKFALAGDTWRFSWVRSKLQGPITSQEAALLLELRPAAEGALRLAQHFAEGQARGMADGALLAGNPVVVINHHGRVSLVSKTAEALLDSSFGITHARLWATDPDTNAKLRLLAATARGTSGVLAPPSIAIRRGPGRLPTLVQAVMVKGIGLDVLPGARIILLLTDLERAFDTDPRDLRSLFQLSAAEAEVAGLIARGLGVPEIADRRGVARETVRVQIKSLFRKMDANKQSDVVRLVDRIARKPSGETEHET